MENSSSVPPGVAAGEPSSPRSLLAPGGPTQHLLESRVLEASQSALGTFRIVPFPLSLGARQGPGPGWWHLGHTSRVMLLENQADIFVFLYFLAGVFLQGFRWSSF